MLEKSLGIGRAGATGRMIPVGDTPMRAVDLVIEGAARRVQPEARGPQPGRLDQGPDRAQPDRVARASRRAAPRLDRDRLDVGQPRRRAGDDRPRARLRVRRGRRSEDDRGEPGQDEPAMGAQLERVRQPDEAGGYLLSRLARVRELCASSDALRLDRPVLEPGQPGRPLPLDRPRDLPRHGRPRRRGLRGRLDRRHAGRRRPLLQAVSPRTRVVGVDARGSVVFGGPPAPRLLTGIGSSRRSSFLTPDLVDEHRLVGDGAGVRLLPRPRRRDRDQGRRLERRGPGRPAPTTWPSTPRPDASPASAPTGARTTRRRSSTTPG